jgi:hypothetical protein
MENKQTVWRITYADIVALGKDNNWTAEQIEKVAFKLENEGLFFWQETVIEMVDYI